MPFKASDTDVMLEGSIELIASGKDINASLIPEEIVSFNAPSIPTTSSNFFANKFSSIFFPS
jgi:hypothetical protein